MPTTRLAVAVVAIAAPIAASGQDVLITTADGRGADAHIARWSPDSNFGGDTALRVKNAATFPPDFDRKAYLRFDVADRPDGFRGLRLTIDDQDGGTPVSGPQVFRVYALRDVAEGVTGDRAPGSGGWAEGTGSEPDGGTMDGIVWNDAPANDTASGSGMTADAVLVARFEFEGVGTPGARVLVSSVELEAALDADTNGLLTLVVTRETFDANPDGYVHNFSSREHLTFEPPALVFNTCLADLDGDGALTIFDFLEFQNLFDAGDPSADFDGDGALTLFDFLAFQNAFDAGCP